MAMGKGSCRLAALQSNLRLLDFLARSNSGLEGRSDAEIAFHGQAVAFHLGTGERLEPAQVPVLRRVAGVLEQAVVREGVDRSAGQDLEEEKGELRAGQGPPH